MKTDKKVKEVTKVTKPKTLRTEIRKEIKKEIFSGVSKKELASPEEFKMFVNQLFYIDDVQTTFKNQRRASVSNNIIKNDELFTKISEMRRVENSTEGHKIKIAGLIKEALVRQINLTNEKQGKSERVELKNVEEHVNSIANRKYDEDKSAQVFELFENDRLKDVENYMEKNLPIFQWCKEIKGLGTKLTAKVFAGIGDIERFPNPASLWSYCGVGDAEASKRVTGQMLKHSPKMRATLYNLQESFIKANSQYRVIYDKRKERTMITHPEWHNLIPCPVKNVGKDAPKTDDKGNVTWANKHPKHAHVDAMRVMIKRFLAELFSAWYISKGINPPSKPYGVEIKGHHEEPMIVPYVDTKHVKIFRK